MRIIAGKAKGQVIKSPKGISLRPTSELIRGALFSILESMATDWSCVLDIYAGTGSLGIEALSRGAGWADFVEQNPRCCVIIKENLARIGMAAQANVYNSSAIKAISFLTRKYGIIVMGPPYRESGVIETLEQLAMSCLVGAGTIIAVEHSYRIPLSTSYGNMRLAKERRHGETCISVYQ
jgi:16S rRNA (guanine(966)-N(2))-methyltransferase RsmD